MDPKGFVIESYNFIIFIHETHMKLLNPQQNVSNLQNSMFSHLNTCNPQLFIDEVHMKPPNPKITTDDRRLVDGITAAGRKNKRGSDVTSDEDIVDESNNFRLTGDTFKENSIHKSCHPSQSHSLEAARCTDGMSSQGTKTANKYSILMEKI
uniref:Uncharacterized protein n=1 Tax=Strongyloides venezuelensis TaxID=75913 RepID=A0A0K0EW58_STRVS